MLDLETFTGTVLLRIGKQLVECDDRSGIVFRENWLAGRRNFGKVQHLGAKWPSATCGGCQNVEGRLGEGLERVESHRFKVEKLGRKKRESFQESFKPSGNKTSHVSEFGANCRGSVEMWAAIIGRRCHFPGLFAPQFLPRMLPSNQAKRQKERKKKRKKERKKERKTLGNWSSTRRKQENWRRWSRRWSTRGRPRCTALKCDQSVQLIRSFGMKLRQCKETANEKCAEMVTGHVVSCNNDGIVQFAQVDSLPLWLT